MSAQPPPDRTKYIVDALSTEAFQAQNVYVNVEQDLIITTHDKVEICLSRYIQNMGERQAWIAPAGILLTIVTVLLTADFKDALLAKDTWQAIFIIGALLSFLWLVLTLWHRPKASSINDVIHEIKVKQGTVVSTTTVQQQIKQS